VSAALRRLGTPAPEPWHAACCPAPWFGPHTTGTKHGDWSAYRNATALAQKHNSSVSLLLRDGNIVDGDRCTPLVLINSPRGCQGRQRVVWRPSEGSGAVHSVTFELLEGHLVQAGFKVQEGPPLSLAHLRGAEEIVVVGSGVGVRPVSTIDGEAVGKGSSQLLHVLRAALCDVRRKGWHTLEDTVEAAAGLKPPVGCRRWPAPTDDWFMPSLAQLLLDSRLWGGDATERGWAPDQLLLHSGGPTSDVASFSMIAGPASLRFRAHQPKATLEVVEDPDLPAERPTCRRRLSPVSGHIPLVEGGLDGQPELQWSVEKWSTGCWEPAGDSQHAHSLAEVLRAVAEVSKRIDPVGPPQSNTEVLQLPVSGSAVAGLLGYDLVQWTEPLRLQHTAKPDDLIGVLYRVDRWLVHDRTRGALWLCAPPGDAWAVAVERLLDEQSATLVPCTFCPLASERGGTGASSSIDDATHAEAVRTVQECIRAGQLYQLNFGRCWAGRLQEEPWGLMQRLFLCNAAPFSAFLSVPDERLALCSSSPELLLAVRAGVASTSPIKGTCGRGACAEEDARLRHGMLASRKEVAEHLMLVDLERHDLGRACAAGSVSWESWRVETFPRVQHMVSSVRGRLSAGADAWDALAALFPGGSITGCPKTATIAAIDALERQRRGCWTGSIGYVDLHSGDCQWNILIRTLEAHGGGEAGWLAEVKAGGGLTIGSEPEAEVEEAKAKAGQLLRTAFGVGAAVVGVGTCSTGLAQHTIEPVDERVEGLLAALAEASRRGEAGCQQCSGDWRRWSRGQALPAVGPAACRVLFVENLDSFSLNIVNACALLGAEVLVVDGRGQGGPSAEEALEAIRPSHVVLGPGPGRPESSPLTMALAHLAVAGSLGIPLLGICFGHQALGLACGWQLLPSTLGAVHGVPERIHHDGRQLFAGLPSPACMVRYNSLVLQPSVGVAAAEEDLAGALEVAAWDETRSLVMAVRHARLPVCGVQFHPESAGSRGGAQLLQAFLQLAPACG